MHFYCKNKDKSSINNVLKRRSEKVKNMRRVVRVQWSDPILIDEAIKISTRIIDDYFIMDFNQLMNKYN